MRNELHFPLNKACKHNENQPNFIDIPIEPNFSERSTNLLGVYQFSLQMVKTASGTVIQKISRNHLSLWHAYLGLAVAFVQKLWKQKYSPET